MYTIQEVAKSLTSFYLIPIVLHELLIVRASLSAAQTQVTHLIYLSVKEKVRTFKYKAVHVFNDNPNIESSPF